MRTATRPVLGSRRAAQGRDPLAGGAHRGRPWEVPGGGEHAAPPATHRCGTDGQETKFHSARARSSRASGPSCPSVARCASRRETRDGPTPGTVLSCVTMGSSAHNSSNRCSTSPPDTSQYAIFFAPRSSATLLMTDLPIAPGLIAPSERVGVPAGQLAGGRSVNSSLDQRAAPRASGAVVGAVGVRADKAGPMKVPPVLEPRVQARACFAGERAAKPSSLLGALSFVWVAMTVCGSIAASSRLARPQGARATFHGGRPPREWGTPRRVRS